MPQIPRHKVFISFHEADRQWRDWFVQALGGGIVDKSVHEEDIDDNPLKTETVRQKIRDEFIADATVTVVLVGPCTWQRKFVDWEIGASLRCTKRNPRCGLVGLLLPTHPDFQQRTYQSELVLPRLYDNAHPDFQRRWTYQPELVPPRLYDNAHPDVRFADIWSWNPFDPVDPVLLAIHDAYQRRCSVNPNNRRPQFKKNLSGACELGWLLEQRRGIPRI